LEATHDALRRHQSDATIWAARADATGDPAEREQLHNAAQAARKEAEQLALQVAQLHAADDARAAWWIETAITRDKAERARVALGLRGIDVDSPDDRVTTQEWLEAHEAEQRDADATRVISEHDIHDDTDTVADDTDTVADDGHAADPQRGPATTPGLPDIRDSSTPGPGERTDPAQRRRVPRPDETAAGVDRAQDALNEITVRREAEAAEQARQAELADWAHHTEDHDGERDQHGHGPGDTPTLRR
jgi:hypothetical protein